MKVQIVSGRSDAEIVDGTAVLVDIFRATSTIPVIFLRGAERIIPFAKILEARKFSKNNENVITIGERYGIRIPGFDYNNSPGDISEVDLKGKTVAFTSTNGTRALKNLTNAEEIVTSSFINHSATVKWLKTKENIWIVRSDRPDGKSQEDEIYSNFLRESLETGKPDIESYLDSVRKCNGARTLERLGYLKDVQMAVKIDLVGFPVFFRNGEFSKGK